MEAYFFTIALVIVGKYQSLLTHGVRSTYLDSNDSHHLKE
ncbi:hypothetical protein SAMN05421823_11824 [Catalinimonas alkaloidigena]|uniref:Uncharacterized protein n=1 Tax=Catalinimonas alkaloidigena TaxID=1075417 RepID=A0A1G9UX54_9BACT|nr:hypothetical protein SAMN05421823_11824 [Catalinimonas alkaloidigena]